MMENAVYDMISMFNMSLKNFYNINMAQEIVKLILSSNKEFIPSHYGNYNGKDRFLSINLDEAIELWINEKLNLKSKKDNFQSGAFIMEKKSGSKIRYSIDWEKKNIEHYNSLNIKLSLDYAMKKKNIQQITEFMKKIMIIVEPLYGKIFNASFPGGYTPIDLTKRLPELHWMLFLGEPYIKMFGREKLLNAPAYKVEELSEKLIAIQLTEDIFKPIPDEARQKIKNYLGVDAFVEKGKTVNDYKDGWAPKLDFSDVMFDKTQPIIIHTPHVLKKEEKVSLEQVFSEQSPEFMEKIITSAQMFKEQNSQLYKGEILNPQKLDFSIESVTEIEKYLDRVKKDKLDEQKMDAICFLCGVYLGEVIRRNTKDNVTYWINLESASKLDKSIADYELTFALNAILANKKTLMYPINKILKYLLDKENNGLKFYATVSVKISSLTESLFSEGKSP